MQINHNNYELERVILSYYKKIENIDWLYYPLIYLFSSSVSQLINRVIRSSTITNFSQNGCSGSI